jgi:hypothetical protein
MVVDGRTVVKVGKASGRSAKDRMLQIVGSYFDVYRVTPVVKIKRDRVVEDVFAKEAELHRYFKDKQYVPEKKFSGSTELFDVGLDVVVDKYEEVIGEKVCKEEESNTREEEGA